MSITEAETLELYRCSLVNAGSQMVLMGILSEFGNDPEAIAQGKVFKDQPMLRGKNSQYHNPD